MKKTLFVVFLSLVLLFLMGCPEGLTDQPLEITLSNITKDSVTIEFNRSIAEPTIPKEITIDDETYSLDIFGDLGGSSPTLLGHYGLLSSSDNSITLAVLGDWGDLSINDYQVKVYTGDPLAPVVIVESEEFTFASWNGIDSTVNTIIGPDPDTEEFYVTVDANDELLLGLTKDDFTIFQAGENLPFNFWVGSDYDEFLPSHEYRIVPDDCDYLGPFHIRFNKAGYNPDNDYYMYMAP